MSLQNWNRYLYNRGTNVVLSDDYATYSVGKKSYELTELLQMGNAFLPENEELLGASDRLAEAAKVISQPIGPDWTYIAIHRKDPDDGQYPRGNVDVASNMLFLPVFPNSGILRPFAECSTDQWLAIHRTSHSVMQSIERGVALPDAIHAASIVQGLQSGEHNWFCDFSHKNPVKPRNWLQPLSFKPKTDYPYDGNALTLDAHVAHRNKSDVEGMHARAHSDGWIIGADIHEDYYYWINEFWALHPKHGFVFGNFEQEVWAPSRSALDAFMSVFPPNSWDYQDI